MESEKVTDIQLRIKAVVIYNFLVLYTDLEKVVKDIFSKSVPRVDINSKYLLYFYYGGRIGTRYEYMDETIKLREVAFKENELFKDYTINEIIRIDRKRVLLTNFPENIASLQRKITFSFKDSILKLIKMRNRLAHELCECHFEEAQIIEILSDDYLKKANYRFIEGLDLTLADDMTKAIFSNYIYMDIIKNELDKINDTTY